MAKKFLTAIDLSKNELQNAAVQNLPSAPSSPVKGQLYFNSTGGDNTLYWWDGSAWVAAKAPSTSGITQGEGDARYVQLNGSVMTGALTLNADPSANLHAATKQYVDTHLTQAEADPLYVNINGDTMTGFLTLNADPTNALHATSKQYVDNMQAGLSWKDACRVATTANIASLTGLAAIDGVTPIANDRVLVKNQTTASANGVYLAQSGAWTRATDADSATDILNLAVFVSEGTTQADTAWVCTADAPITVGTTNLPFIQFAGTGGSVPPNRTISTTAPLTGGGDLSANRTLDISVFTQTVKGAVPPPVSAPSGKYLKDDGTWAAPLGGTQKFAANVGGTTAQAITHNLNTRDVSVDVFRNSTPWETVECDIERTDANNVTLRFNVAPAANEYRAVVVG